MLSGRRWASFRTKKGNDGWPILFFNTKTLSIKALHRDNLKVSDACVFAGEEQGARHHWIYQSVISNDECDANGGEQSDSKLQ